MAKLTRIRRCSSCRRALPNNWAPGVQLCGICWDEALQQAVQLSRGSLRAWEVPLDSLADGIVDTVEEKVEGSAFSAESMRAAGGDFKWRA